MKPHTVVKFPSASVTVQSPPMPFSPAVKQGMVSDPIKRTKSIKVYLFEQEKTTIEEKAIATGVTASEYLRSCGLRRVLTAKPPAD